MHYHINSESDEGLPDDITAREETTADEYFKRFSTEMLNAILVIT